MSEIFYTPNEGSHPGKPAGKYEREDVERMETERAAFTEREVSRINKERDQAAKAKAKQEQGARDDQRAQAAAAEVTDLKKKALASYPGTEAAFEKAWSGGLRTQVLNDATRRGMQSGQTKIEKDSASYVRNRF